MFISIDPGKNNGVASFSDEGQDIKKKVMQEEEFLHFLQMLLVIKGDGKNHITFILEDFKLRQDKAIDQTGSDMPSSRMIGAVQFADRILGDQSDIVYQRPGILNSALKWAGYSDLANKGRGYHVPDDIAAYSHGVYYLITQNLRKHPIFNENS